MKKRHYIQLLTVKYLRVWIRVRFLTLILLGTILVLFNSVYGFADEWNAPPRGQPNQIRSQVNYNPDLRDPFFESDSRSCPDGCTECIKCSKGEPRLKHTADVRVSPSRLSEHPPVHFCEARLVDANSLDLFIHQSTASSKDALIVQIRNGLFRCQYWSQFFTERPMEEGEIIWTTTEQELTLDKKVYRRGDEIKGRIYLQCWRQPADPKAKGAFGWRGIIEVRGVVKTTVE